MSRTDENANTINYLVEQAEKTPTMPSEQMVCHYLGEISTLLADISRSLAIIADKGVQG